MNTYVDIYQITSRIWNQNMRFLQSFVLLSIYLDYLA